MAAVIDSANGQRNLSWRATAPAARPGPRSAPTPKCRCYRGYVTSFVGFAPLDDPQMLTYVVITNPRTADTGTTTAGPVYRDVMTIALPRYSVPPDAKAARTAAHRVVSLGAIAASGSARPRSTRPNVAARRRVDRRAPRGCGPQPPPTADDPDRSRRADPGCAAGRRSPASRWTRGWSGRATSTSRCPGRHHHGAEFAAAAAAGGARAVLTDADGAGWPAASRCRSWWSTNPRRAGGRDRGRDLRASGRGDDHVRGHRDQRQDHDDLPARGGAAPRPGCGPGWSAPSASGWTARPLRRDPDHGDHPGGHRAAGPARLSCARRAPRRC